MTSQQPTQHLPPRVQLAIAGMLPAGVELVVYDDYGNPRYDLTIPGGNAVLVYRSQSEAYAIRTEIKVRYSAGWYSAQRIRDYANLLQAAADVCDWLNEHWKPE